HEAHGPSGPGPSPPKWRFTAMRRSLLVAALLLTATVPLLLAEELPLVTYVSPAKCEGDHGKWRWAAKTEDEAPPDSIPNTHRVTPADVGDWDAPPGPFAIDTPRGVGRRSGSN